MKIEKEKKVPARTEAVLDHIVCDLCGAKSDHNGDWVRRPSVAEVTVEFKEGANYGSDGVDLKTTIVDICPECFKGKLLPWLESQGAKSRVEEDNW